MSRPWVGDSKQIPGFRAKPAIEQSFQVKTNRVQNSGVGKFWLDRVVNLNNLNLI